MFLFLINYDLNFQKAATPVMEGILDLHHTVFFFIVIIFTFVMSALLYLVNKFSLSWNFASNKQQIIDRDSYKYTYNIIHWTWLEIIWTLIPSVILMLIALPSFMLLYSIDEVISPMLTVKITGYQWYWNYEFGDYNKKINYDSFLYEPMSKKQIIKLNKNYLLHTTKSLVLPVNTHIRLLVSARDVIHSWALPSFGVKIDAVPGRLNQVSIFIKREGIYYGQCSELCGKGHAAMPIEVKVVSVSQYINWLKNYN